MKKLLLILIFLPLIFSCEKKKEERKVTADDIIEVKDDIIKKVNEEFDGESVGIFIRDIYNEGESTIVMEYNIRDYIFVGDEELKKEIKAATPLETITLMRESNLNAKYRYYLNDKIVKEVTITADEW